MDDLVSSPSNGQHFADDAVVVLFDSIDQSVLNALDTDRPTPFEGATEWLPALGLSLDAAAGRLQLGFGNEAKLILNDLATEDNLSRSYSAVEPKTSLAGTVSPVQSRDETRSCRSRSRSITCVSPMS
ncbi:MAG TPA: hypothetical protein VIV13_00505 [Solirubrobacterales bacterium]